MKVSKRHPESSGKERLLGCEFGASSGEFAFAIMVLAIAIVVGGLGGVWIAKREGVQKPKATEPLPVTEQPSDQTPKPPESDKSEQPPLKAPSPGPPESDKPAQPPPKAPSTKPPEAKPQAAVPVAKTAEPRLPSVEAIHYSSRAGTTEVTIELGAVSLVKAAGLSSPERVYFDFQAAGIPATARGRLDAQNSMSVSDDPLLAGIRVARWKSGDIRVVFDLRRSCDFSYAVAPEPSPRLIVELKPR